MDKLFEGIRAVTTKIYKFLVVVEKGCAKVIRLMGLFVLAFSHGILKYSRRLDSSHLSLVFSTSTVELHWPVIFNLVFCSVN